MSDFPHGRHYAPLRLTTPSPCLRAFLRHARVDIITGVMFTNAEGFVASGQIKAGDAATGHLGAHLSGSSEWVNPY